MTTYQQNTSLYDAIQWDGTDAARDQIAGALQISQGVWSVDGGGTLTCLQDNLYLVAEFPPQSWLVSNPHWAGQTPSWQPGVGLDNASFTAQFTVATS